MRLPKWEDELVERPMRNSRRIRMDNQQEKFDHAHLGDLERRVSVLEEKPTKTDAGETTIVGIFGFMMGMLVGIPISQVLFD